MENRERIIKGTEGLFFQYGVKNVTMDDIASQLGISKKTIYRYFSDKSSLVCEVTEVHLKEEEKEMEAISQKAADPIEEILINSEYIRKVFQNMNPTLLFELQKYYPKAWQIFQEHKITCFHDSIIKNLKNGIEKGLYRQGINISLLARLRLEQVEMAMNPMIFPRPEYNMHEVQVELLDHFLHGICTLKGHKLINKYKHIQEEE